jgi:hypothetical protein
MTNEKRFKLDMDFWEAMKRFARTERPFEKGVLAGWGAAHERSVSAFRRAAAPVEARHVDGGEPSPGRRLRRRAGPER